MPKQQTQHTILRVYPSSSSRFAWSTDSVCSATTVQSSPPSDPRDANPFNPLPATPPTRVPTRQSPFRSGQKINHYTDGDHYSTILGTYGARYDSKGHILYKVEIAHPMHNSTPVLVTYELYERATPSFIVVFLQQTWRFFKNLIGS
jgi:hypothetical protein